ncbi:MAG: OB-fold domain-containing protein [Dehalococcoidales bacterium]|nr:OB-fold domain-containing protein [Dehalococcoidales bacterium]
MTSKEESVKFTGQPANIIKAEPALVIEWPMAITHRHTYGKLSPFFKGLTEGKLLATKCVNPECDEHRLWLPPRADCPDCNQPMKWQDIPQPVMGTVYTYARVEYAGAGIELSTPYYQVDVELPGVCTIFKGYLANGEPKIGMKVKAAFRTENPTHTILDICWTPA